MYIIEMLSTPILVQVSSKHPGSSSHIGFFRSGIQSDNRRWWLYFGLEPWLWCRLCFVGKEALWRPPCWLCSKRYADWFRKEICSSFGTLSPLSPDEALSICSIFTILSIVVIKNCFTWTILSRHSRVLSSAILTQTTYTCWYIFPFSVMLFNT